MIPQNGRLLPFQRPKPDAVALLLGAEQLHKKGQLILALRAYRLIAESCPSTHPVTLRAMFLASLCAFQMRLYDDARQLMEAVRSATFEDANVHYNLGLIYDALGQLEDSADSYRVALALKPDNGAAEVNLGNVFRQMGDIEGAEQCFNRMIERNPRDPEARYNLAHVMLTRGDLANGFREYEERWRCEGWVAEYGRPDLRAPRWTVDSPARTVLVHAEQGFGDTLQFMRYLPLLLDRGLTVHFEVQPQLRSLLNQLARPGLTVFSRGEPPPSHEAQIPLLSLTAALGTTSETIPALLPITAPEGPAWLPETGLRVGVCWSGNPNHHNDRNRSARLAQLLALFAVPETTWINLQVGPGGSEFAVELPRLLAAGATCFDPSAHLRDFHATAGLIAGLDLVITVDTVVAHLAATLGKPVWLMVPHLADWRWLVEGERSAWYPTLRIIRQPAQGDWISVARAVRELLEAA